MPIKNSTTRVLLFNGADYEPYFALLVHCAHRYATGVLASAFAL